MYNLVEYNHLRIYIHNTVGVYYYSSVVVSRTYSVGEN